MEKAHFPSLTDVVKGEFVLLSAFMLYLGVVSTDAYYRSFGLRFQFLSYPWNLMLFKGIFTALRFPSVWAIIIVVCALAQVDRTLCAKTAPGFHRIRIPIFYILVFGVLWLTTVLGTSLGATQALTDAQLQKTSLPHIEKLVMSNGADEPCKQCVLLMISSSDVACLQLDGDPSNAIAHTKIYSRSSIARVEITR